MWVTLRGDYFPVLEASAEFASYGKRLHVLRCLIISRQRFPELPDMRFGVIQLKTRRNSSFSGELWGHAGAGQSYGSNVNDHGL